MTAEQDKRIRDWIAQATKPENLDRLYDIHIDEVDSTLRGSKVDWISYSIKTYIHILSAIDSAKYVLFLSVLLRGGFNLDDRPTSIFAIDASMLSHTPPSFFIFPMDYKIVTAATRTFLGDYSMETGLKVEYFSTLPNNQSNDTDPEDYAQGFSIWI